eukprot:UN09922
MAMEQAKKHFVTMKTKTKQRLTMEGLLKQARRSFEYYMNPKFFQKEQRFSREVLKGAHGIVFMTEVKAGAFMFGAKGGTGIIICRSTTNKEEWTAPIAIGTVGASFGFQLGISKVDHIIILPKPYHVQIFLGKGQLQIKGNAEAAVAKYGRDVNVGVGVGNKAAAPVLSYSFGVKGIYGGISLDSAILMPRNDCNTRFYGKKVQIKDIGYGLVETSVF